MDSSDDRHRFIAFESIYPLAYRISALVAAILAYTNQGATLSELGWYTLTGFELPHYNPLADIIHGGGLQTMFIPTLSIFMATAISGMLEGVGFWNDVRQLLERAKTRSDVFAANVWPRTLNWRCRL